MNSCHTLSMINWPNNNDVINHTTSYCNNHPKRKWNNQDRGLRYSITEHECIQNEIERRLKYKVSNFTLLNRPRHKIQTKVQIVHFFIWIEIFVKGCQLWSYIILCLFTCLSNLVVVDALGLPTNHNARYTIAVFQSFTIAVIKWPSTAMRCRQPGVADHMSSFWIIQSHATIQCSY